MRCLSVIMLSSARFNTGKTGPPKHALFLAHNSTLQALKVKSEDFFFFFFCSLSSFLLCIIITQLFRNWNCVTFFLPQHSYKNLFDRHYVSISSAYECRATDERFKHTILNWWEGKYQAVRLNTSRWVFHISFHSSIFSLQFCSVPTSFPFFISSPFFFFFICLYSVYVSVLLSSSPPFFCLSATIGGVSEKNWTSPVKLVFCGETDGSLCVPDGSIRDCLCRADKCMNTHTHIYTHTHMQGWEDERIVYAEAEWIFMSRRLLFMGKYTFKLREM